VATLSISMPGIASRTTNTITPLSTSAPSPNVIALIGTITNASSGQISEFTAPITNPARTTSPSESERSPGRSRSATSSPIVVATVTATTRRRIEPTGGRSTGSSSRSATARAYARGRVAMGGPFGRLCG
jgi:hypothetical protein